ncbi:hypothetical protein O9X98_06115 [Agrobacterium salinitolerans]|nr:hypothetical protein [Agrobacterium salinitolerans]
MIIFLENIDRARQAAKSLKHNFEQGPLPIIRPLTWHQDTVAQMLGHANWKALLESIKRGEPASPTDQQVDRKELEERLEFQARVLLLRVGDELIQKFAGEGHFRTIARHVAPSGRPRGGTGVRTMKAILTEDGISVPISLDIWSEDALFQWGHIRDQGDYGHVSEHYDPEVEELHTPHTPMTENQFKRCGDYIEGKPYYDLDAQAIHARMCIGDRQFERAQAGIVEAYDVGSQAWAPVARERRRCHNPVRWWDEKATRPFMRVLYEMAILSALLGEPEEARRLFGLLLALNPSDPLQVEQWAEKEFMFYDEEKVAQLLKDLA